jgi:hypothetical protein
LGNDTVLKRKPFIPVAEEAKQQKELLVDPIPPLTSKRRIPYVFPNNFSIFHKISVGLA